MKSLKATLKLGSSSNRYAPRLPQQETKSSTKQLAPTDPILGPEKLLKTGFAQKGLPSKVKDRHPPGRHGHCSSARCYIAGECIPFGTRNPSGPNGPKTGSLAQRAKKSGNETCVRTKQSQSWNGCRLENQPLSKNMEEKCSLPLCFTSGGKSISGSSQCLHPSHHQDHARQTEPPSYCTNDQPRGKR